MSPAMKTVTSADGTSIGYERHGEGPSLILLHGGSGTRRHWDALRSHLTDDFTLSIPDRRGRGGSGDGDKYDLSREVADLRALVEAVDGPTTVFGHSFGGLVALVAASEISLDRLVLYEPALLVGDHRGDDLASRMESRLNAGQRQDAMRLFLEEAGGIPDVEQLPWWPEEAGLSLAETVVRENYEVEAYELPAEPDIDVPTLLLTGEYGPAHLRDAVFELDERLSDSRVVEFDGVGHVATQSEPELVADAVRTFVYGD
nr:alpha/beta hydrolase [Halogeometricum borinquense]